MDDIGIYYFSSSSNKEFIKDQKKNSQDYRYKVVQTFETRKEALELEIKLHSKFNVGINENFYNRAKQTSTGFDTTGINLSEEHKLKCSLGNLGSKRSIKQRYNMSESMKGIKKSEEHKRNLSKANEGNSLSEKTKRKISKCLKEKHSNGLIKTTSKTILIFNQNNVIIYISKGHFESFCKNFNLPFKAFKKSYQKDGELLYNSKMAKTKVKNKDNEKYIGWYAKIKE